MSSLSKLRALLLLCLLLGLALLVPSAGARSHRHHKHHGRHHRVHRMHRGHHRKLVRSSMRCTRKHHGRSLVRKCHTRRSVRMGGATRRSTSAAGRAPANGQGPAAAAPAPGGCADANLVPAPKNLDRIAAATLCLVNQQRAGHSERPLTPDPALDAAAAAHSADMVRRNFFEHSSSDGSSTGTRLLASGFVPGGSGYLLGENLAWATGSLATPAAIVTGWMHSPEHRANILNGRYSSSGLGVVPAVPAVLDNSGQTAATYTQDFGTVLG